MLTFKSNFLFREVKSHQKKKLKLKLCSENNLTFITANTQPALLPVKDSRAQPLPHNVHEEHKSPASSGIIAEAKIGQRMPQLMQLWALFFLEVY